MMFFSSDLILVGLETAIFKKKRNSLDNELNSTKNFRNLNTHRRNITKVGSKTFCITVKLFCEK